MGQTMTVIEHHTLERRHTPIELLEIASEWDELAEIGGTPFLTAEWLAAWWNAFGRGQLDCFVLRDGNGRLRAGACCSRNGATLAGTANVHSGNWDVVASDEGARAALWQGLAERGPDRVILPSILDPRSVEAAERSFRTAGYAVAATPAVISPFLTLPPSWDDLLASVGRGLRSEFRRKRRRLEREGRLVFRTTRGGEELDADLRAVFSVEASGWKSRSRTAIISSPVTEALYTEFAVGLARAGWLRIHLLELDGDVIAADLACSFAGGSFLIKTGFDERFAALSPGLVLRGEAIRSAVEEGARSYDFLGGPDHYKLRWRPELRPRVTVRAFKGWRRPIATYYSRLRPPLRSAALRARDLRARVGSR
jgi:hypothetical protein